MSEVTQGGSQITFGGTREEIAVGQRWATKPSGMEVVITWITPTVRPTDEPRYGWEVYRNGARACSLATPFDALQERLQGAVRVPRG